jgi:hypothetical protein
MRETTRSCMGDGREPPHPDIHAALPAYAASIILGDDPESVYPHVARHLAGCSTCRAELGEIVALATPLYHREPVPAATPAFNLSFLTAQQGAPEPQRHWWYDQLGRLVIQLSQDLLRSLIPPAAAIATRGDSIPQHQLRVESPQGIRVTIEVLVAPDDAAHATIQVVVDQLAKDPLDQPSVTVTLRASAQTWSVTTDPIGVATFHGIPIATLPEIQVTVEAVG